MFRFLRKLGTGINGHVILVENKSNFESVAMKKLPYDCHLSLREINIWKEVFSHANIVTILDVHMGHNDYFVSMEPMCMCLTQFMKTNQMNNLYVEKIFHSILTALSHCHEKNILHRDVKPDNILLNICEVKLCDFSLSCKKNECKSTDVVTLWYRCPELLFKVNDYDESIDIWSAVCVLYEMMTGRPPFMAEENTEISQLKSICEVLGVPSEAQDMGFVPKYDKDFFFKNFPPFMQNVFVFDYKNRPSALHLLQFCSSHNVKFDLLMNHRASLSESIPEDWKEIFSSQNVLEYSHLL